MSEPLPPDRYRLEVLEFYLQQQLDRVRAALRRLDETEAASRPAGRRQGQHQGHDIEGPGATAPLGDPSDPRRPRPGAAPGAGPRPDPPEWHPHPAGGPPADDDTPWWRLQPRQGDGPAILHRGDCPEARGLVAIERPAALVAAAEPYVRPCFSCQPQDTLT